MILSWNLRHNSTLINLFTELFDVTEGSIKIDSLNIKDYSVIHCEQILVL